MKEKLKEKLRPFVHVIKNLLKFRRRIGLKNKKVSIISNNCGGGFITQFFGLKYYSPTEGLFFHTSDYLRFAKNIHHYIENCELVFINPMEANHLDYLKDTRMYGDYPVARLGDIEIYFMHYHSIKEAKEKWIRRSKRIDFNNIVFVLFENETTTHDMLVEFDSLENNHLELVFNSFSDLKNAYRNNNVFNHPEHAWKPEWVMNTLNWKKYFNSIKDD